MAVGTRRTAPASPDAQPVPHATASTLGQAGTGFVAPPDSCRCLLTVLDVRARFGGHATSAAHRGGGRPGIFTLASRPGPAGAFLRPWTPAEREFVGVQLVPHATSVDAWAYPCCLRYPTPTAAFPRP
jgi:hypothetical protein